MGVKMTNEVIIPSLYFISREEESGCFPGVAYKQVDGSVKNEILWGYNKFLSVSIVNHSDENAMLNISHVFVERYISRCLEQKYDDVEVFRFYINKGAAIERPFDLRGDTISQYKDTHGHNIWISYEHISGPYLADPQYLVSAFTSESLDDISPIVMENLVIDKASYKNNPQDLPVMGVLIGKEAEDETAQQQKYLEDLLIKTRVRKPVYIN